MMFLGLLYGRENAWAYVRGGRQAWTYVQTRWQNGQWFWLVWWHGVFGNGVP